LLEIVIDCNLRVSFIIRIEGVESSKIFNAVQHERVKMILFNSVYTYAKEELGLNDTDALTLAQFIVDNQDKLTKG
jgi:predicted nucleic acid-binding protein